MPNEECRYVWIDEEGDMQEVPEDEVPGCCDVGSVVKIIRHDNGKIAVYNASTLEKIILEM